MPDADYQLNPCALCDGEDFAEVTAVHDYTNGQSFHICKNCGLVQVPRRRTAAAIAAAWSDEVFAEDYTDLTYTARIPHVLARQTFVAATMDDAIGVKGKTICDIGAGEGQLLEILRRPEYGAEVFGVEPSPRNCQIMDELGIDQFEGAVEDWSTSGDSRLGQFDFATILWTLEASSDPRGMLKGAYETVKDGGHVVIGMGSRILVPFKKPLFHYCGHGEPVDQHPFHFSFNTLKGMLAEAGFRMAYVNRYIDNDVMCMIGEKVADPAADIEWEGDDWQAVMGFFERWHKDTRDFYA